MINVRAEKYTAAVINSLAAAGQEFLLECSKEYQSKVEDVSKRIFEDKSKKIVMLAGPSSSGKTTTAALLSEKIKNMGGVAYTVSLDDFYHPRSVGYPLDENGEPDYECVEALDLELIHRCFGELLGSGSCSLPRFDFMSGERIADAKTVTLDDNSVIIVEGLHALNPVITDTLDASNLYKIYVSVSSRIYENNGNVLFSKRDLRFIRRMVRDYSFRSTSVDRTFEIWESVMRGEDKYLFPFEHLADVKINSFHPCEPCVLAQRAKKLLSESLGGEHGKKASDMINRLELFDCIDYNLLPKYSLLREFTG